MVVTSSRIQAGQVAVRVPTLVEASGSTHRVRWLRSLFSRLWASVHIDWESHYSLDKLLCLYKYKSTTSLSGVLLPLLLTPLPTLLITVVVEFIPLNDPALGWRANYTFFIQTFVRWSGVAAVTGIQWHCHMPELSPPMLPMAIVTFIQAAWVLGGYYRPHRSCGCVSGPVLAFRRRTCVYEQRLGHSSLLGASKALEYRWPGPSTCGTSQTRETIGTSNSQLFHQLFTAACFQTSKSGPMLLLILLFGFLQDILSFRAIQTRQNLVIRHQTKSYSSNESHQQELERLTIAWRTQVASKASASRIPITSSCESYHLQASEILHASGINGNKLSEISTDESEWLERLTHYYHCCELVLLRMYLDIFVSSLYLIVAGAMRHSQNAQYRGFLGSTDLNVLMWRMGPQIAARCFGACGALLGILTA